MQDGTILKIIFWFMITLGFSITISHISESQKSEIPLPPQTEQISDNQQNVGVNNKSMTNNNPSYGWGWSDDYCLRNLKLKDGTIIRYPRCEF